LENNNFLLACYKGFFARIEYDEASEAWIGRVFDTQDLIVFSDTTLERTLATFHAGTDEYLKNPDNHAPEYRSSALNLVRYGIEDPSFIEEAKEAMQEEEEHEPT